MKKHLYKALAQMARTVKKLDTSTDVHLYQRLYHPESLKKGKFYNVGAGSFVHPCWTNVDDGGQYYEVSNSKSKSRINHDLFSKQPLPVSDNYAEVVYTSHTLEHIDNDSVLFFLKDSYRILKKQGVIRIVVPDIDLSYRAWRINDRDYFYWTEWEHANRDFKDQCINIPLKNASLAQIFLEDFAAAVSEIALEGEADRISDEQLQEIFESLSFEQALDYCTSRCSVEVQKKYPFRHMNWFNEAKLLSYLKEAGFKTVFRSGYLQSSVPILRNFKFFDTTMPRISLYMEAIK